MTIDRPPHPDAVSSTEVGDTASVVVARAWSARRDRERMPLHRRVISGLAMGVFAIVVLNPTGIPGGAPVALALLVAALLVGVTVVLADVRGSGLRGHSGSLDPLEFRPKRSLWRSPLAYVVGLFALISLVRALENIGPGAVTALAASIAVASALWVAWAVPRAGVTDPVYGTEPDVPPALSDAAVEALHAGDLDVRELELAALQVHAGERRVSWCAAVLGVDEVDIRDRVTSGSRWLEYPADELHRPGSARWLRLTRDGRGLLRGHPPRG